MADDGYVGEAPGKVKCPCTQINLPDERVMQSIVRIRYETLNGRLKQPFHHDNIMQHGTVFHHAVNTLQVAIDEGGKLFFIEYNDA